MTYAEALAYLYSFADYEQVSAAPARFDLRRVARLLDALGDPHAGRLTVHVAGTKGKGSIAAMLAAVVQSAGYRTGLLTSPHLCDFRERIRVDGRPIAADALAAIVERLRPHVDAYHADASFGRLTTFELSTAAAFLHFQAAGATAQVLETGMGGRLDATNVVAAPDLCIITPISLDHTEVLGSRLEEIAGEKAGIIKAGRPVVMSPQEPEAERVIARRCYEQGARLVRVAAHARWDRVAQDLRGQSFRVTGLEAGFDLWTPLLGGFQMENAATVTLASELLRQQGFGIGGEHLRRGLAAVRWPGRLQVLRQDPVLLLDGAHNGASARRLAEALASDFPHERTVLIAGTSADKDQDAIARELGPGAAAVIATRSDSPRASEPEALADAFRPYCPQTATAPTVTAAIEQAYTWAGPRDLICVTGSLYLVGEALKALGMEAAALDSYAVEGAPAT